MLTLVDSRNDVICKLDVLSTSLEGEENQRPWKCDHCGKRFSQRCHLRNHRISNHPGKIASWIHSFLDTGNVYIISRGGFKESKDCIMNDFLYAPTSNVVRYYRERR